MRIERTFELSSTSHQPQKFEKIMFAVSPFHSFKCWRFFQITNDSSVCVPLLSQHCTAYSNRQRCLHKYKSESFQKVQLLSTIREQLWVATDESTGLTTAEWDIESSSASVLGWLELYHECWEHQEPSSGS